VRRPLAIPRKRDERGVVAIALALISCFVLVPVAALAVDLGVQRVARTDMQSLADMVAMDLARNLDGKTTAAQWSGKSPSIQERAEASRDQNDSTVGETPTVVAALGTFDVATNEFTELPSTSPEIPTAVKVTASTSVQFGFAGGEGSTTRSAVAQAETSACFQVGSFAATLDPSASSLFKDMLTPLLGSSTLTAAGYNGLASTRLSLLDLVNSDYIGVGTVNELLTMDDLTVADMYHAAAQVLAAKGKTAQAQVFNIASTSTVAPVTIDAGKLFAMTTASDAALQTQFNALDLLLGTAFLANGNNLLDIANLQTSLGSVGVTSSQLRLIERAQHACNQDVAQTAQATLVATAKTTVENSPLINSNGAQLRIVDASGSNSNDINLAVNVSLAGAEGRLAEVKCDPDVFDVDVTTALVQASVTGSAYIKGSVKVDIPGFGTGVTVPIQFKIAISGSTSQPASGPTRAELMIPPKTYDDYVRVGSGKHVIPHVSVTIDGAIQVTGTVTVSILGVSTPVPALNILNAVTPVVTPLVAGLAGTGRIGSVADPLVDKVNTIIGQLQTGMGLTVGGADVYGLPYPNCQSPRLSK
jgi:uncharacterized membrane protein